MQVEAKRTSEEGEITKNQCYVSSGRFLTDSKADPRSTSFSARLVEEADTEKQANKFPAEFHEERYQFTQRSNDQDITLECQRNITQRSGASIDPRSNLSIQQDENYTSSFHISKDQTQVGGVLTPKYDQIWKNLYGPGQIIEYQPERQYYLSSATTFHDGGQGSYVELMNSIISSQEDISLQQELQLYGTTFTDALTTNIHPQSFEREFEEQSHCYVNQDRVESIEADANSEQYTNNEESSTDMTISFGDSKKMTNLKGLRTLEENGDGSDCPEANWQLDIFSELQVEQVETRNQFQDEPRDTITRSDNTDVISEGTSEGLYLEEFYQENEATNNEYTEEEVEEFIQRELTAASEGNNADLNSIYTPQMGQQFKTREDAQHYFNLYAFLAGFTTHMTHVVRTTSKKRNNEIVKQEMKCTKHEHLSTKQSENEEETFQIPHAEGKKCGEEERKAKRKTNVEAKTNCQVVMVVKEKNGIWTVSRLNLDHNHSLSPGSRNELFSGHKYMTDMEKSLIRTLSDNNIPTRKMVAILSTLRGGVTANPCDKKAVSNYRTKINREVSGNDLTQALEFFRKKKAEDPSFFYKFDIDDSKKLKNMFWCDASSIQYYAEYGDLVSFDTTLMTNRYNLPFAPFVGITGHSQSCLFGCAFLADETAETFKWVFEAFLEAVGGKHPVTIITNQDKAMRSAIAIVFPNTIHRNCLFHIKRKCYDKNLRCFGSKENEGLFEEFEDIINNSLTRGEFDMLWKKMIADYKLENNKYFTKMWENRDRFVPVYFKDNFCPFIHSTGRSEGTNSRFKDTVGPTYSIISFLREYQRIIDTIDSSERFEDNISKQKQPKELWGSYYIERQGMELYNRKIFKKFQNEVKATTKLNYKCKEEGKVYEVFLKKKIAEKHHRPRTFVVVADMENLDFSCICCKFEKDGILCSHILKIMVEEDLSDIPSKYIIDRWRKKESKMVMHKRIETTKTHELLRFNMLSRKAAILNSKGSKKDKTLKYLMAEYIRLEDEVDKMLLQEEDEDILEGTISTETIDNSRDKNIPASDGIEEILQLDVTKGKGRPLKPKRLKGLIEQIKEKMAKEEEAKEGRKKKKSDKANNQTSSPQGKKKKQRKNSGEGV